MLIEVENLVIGRGPVGVVTSHALLNKSLAVVNLDIGPNAKLTVQDLKTESNINYTAANKPPSLVKEANEHLWGGACMGWQYFHSKNSKITELPALPISKLSFVDACKQLSKILQISNFDFSRDKPISLIKFGKFKELRFVFAKIVKDPYMTRQIEALHSNPNYKYISNVTIYQLNPKGEAIECKGRFVDTNQEVTFVCNRVFLAAGTISNTKILIKSNLLSINRNFLGKYLSDHVSLPIASIVTEDLLQAERYFGYKKSAKGTRIWPRVKLLDEQISILDSFCYVTEISASTEMGAKVLGLLRRFPILKFIFRVKVKGKFQLNLFSEVFNSVYNEISPNNSSEDFSVNFVISQSDLINFSNIASSYIKALTSTPMMRSASLTTIFDFDKNLQMLQAGSHPSGTYRMSASTEEGVVNPFSQLHSHSKVYVLGAGALPRSAATHPTFTAMVLALIAVDSITI